MEENAKKTRILGKNAKKCLVPSWKIRYNVK